MIEKPEKNPEEPKFKTTPRIRGVLAVKVKNYPIEAINWTTHPELTNHEDSCGLFQRAGWVFVPDSFPTGEDIPCAQVFRRDGGLALWLGAITLGLRERTSDSRVTRILEDAFLEHKHTFFWGQTVVLARMCSPKVGSLDSEALLSSVAANPEVRWVELDFLQPLLGR